MIKPSTTYLQKNDSWYMNRINSYNLEWKGAPMTITIRLNDAKNIINAAEKKAAEIGQPVNIAVVDSGANLVAHVRMDGA
jgi:Haem-degrading